MPLVVLVAVTHSGAARDLGGLRVIHKHHRRRPHKVLQPPAESSKRQDPGRGISLTYCRCSTIPERTMGTSVACSIRSQSERGTVGERLFNTKKRERASMIIVDCHMQGGALSFATVLYMRKVERQLSMSM